MVTPAAGRSHCAGKDIGWYFPRIRGDHPKKNAIRPHKTKYWLHPKIDDLEEFRERVRKLCDAYLNAKRLKEAGIMMASLDEKTGIQALQRLHPDIPCGEGKTALREYEYIRHGTLSLMAARDVAGGKIVSRKIKETRTEEDFLDFIQHAAGTDPKKKWLFIADQLNTHMSASLVEWIAGKEGYEGDLGKKGVRGILKNKETRKAFLEDESHSIRFLFTPKHCSWLNQVEVWFNQLDAHVVRRGNFTSKDDLEAKIDAYIDYYNECLAKPYDWKYTGDKVCYLFR